MPDNPLAADLDEILERLRPVAGELKGARIFITGGTGFFGCWLLESLGWMNEQLNLDASALVLTRNVEAFRRKAPHLANRADIRFHAGDVRNFDFPKETFSHLIHAATEASAQLNDNHPEIMLDAIVQGTRHTLDFAKTCGATHFLLTSSGAVYGPQPSELTHITEEFNGGPDVTRFQSAYAEGKRMSELLCAIEAHQTGLAVKIARCFAFVGPHLPLDAHFAIGNFIRDAMKGGPITINGDGTPFRSYLYAGDLMVWLWTILIRGAANRPYNVGSPRNLTIAELAEIVAKSLATDVKVEIARQPVPGQPPARYVPATTRAETELDLTEWTSLPEAIRRTAKWSRSHSTGH